MLVTDADLYDHLREPSEHQCWLEALEMSWDQISRDMEDLGFELLYNHKAVDSAEIAELLTRIDELRVNVVRYEDLLDDEPETY